MASEVQINAVVDAIVTAFGGDAALFQAFLTRGKLEQELAALESAERNLRDGFTDDTTDFNAALAANQALQADKQAEIDAL